MEAYIKSSATISPQASFDEGFFNGVVCPQEAAWLKCKEPDYKELINPSLIRRMSRIVKMGVACALKSLKEAGIEKPDAIITGTGLGCMEDTGNFLTSIIKDKEQFLTPTAFIQSTHNTIAGQIALMIKCNNYNFAYVHRGFSFESALLDAMMMLDQKEAQSILLGGIDEITQDYWNVTRRLGMWKTVIPDGKSLYASNSRGTIAGEGSAFFVLTGDSNGTFARFRAVDMIYQPESTAVIATRIQSFLEKNELSIEEVDAVMLGLNGWPRYDTWYTAHTDSLFAGKPILVFKHLSGEYMTASSFAAWLSASAIRHATIPDNCILRGKAPGKFKNILVYNHFMGINHTLMLLSSC